MITSFFIFSRRVPRHSLLTLFLFHLSEPNVRLKITPVSCILSGLRQIHPETRRRPLVQERRLRLKWSLSVGALLRFGSAKNMAHHIFQSETEPRGTRVPVILA
jgi:hypothetical protein